jgi:hypothetical protein
MNVSVEGSIDLSNLKFVPASEADREARLVKAGDVIFNNTNRELHKRGYQLLRVMPFMSPSGAYWRCWIGPAKFFYRNHGAILHEVMPSDEEVQESASIARYTSGQTNEYFAPTASDRD